MKSFARLIWLATFIVPTIVAAAPLNKAAVDAIGDPLPEGALMRFGSNRLRHGQPITGAVFSPDSKRVASAGGDYRIRIWSVEDGREVATFTLPQFQAPVILSYSADGALLAVANRANYAAVFEISSGKQLWQDLTQPAQGLAWSSDGKHLAMTRADGVVRIVEPRTGKLEIECIRQNIRLSVAAFTSNDKVLLAVADDKSVRRFDTTTGKLLGTVPMPKTIGINGGFHFPRLTFSADGSALVLVDSLNGVWHWPIEGEPRRLTAPEVGTPSHSTSISSDGRFISTSNADSGLAVWGVASGKVLRVFNVSPYQVAAVLSPDARRLASFSNSDRVLRLWNMDDGKPVGPEQPSGDTQLATMLDGGKTVVAATNQGYLVAWDAATGKIRDKYKNPIGGYVAIGSTDGKIVRAIDIQQCSVVWEPGQKGETRARTAPVIQLTYPNYFAPNGEWIAVRAPNGGISLRESETGKEIKSFQLENRVLNLQSFHMSPDLRWFLASDNNRMLRMWEVDGGRLLPTFGTMYQTLSPAISPDGRVVVAVETNSLAVWESASGRTRLRVPLVNTPIRSLGITRDHRLILLGNPQGELILYDGADGKEIKRLAAHNGGVRTIWFPPSGNRFLTVGDDGTLLLWDAERLVALATAKPLPPENVADWVNDLSHLNAENAAAAIRSLARHPDAAIKFIHTLGKPAEDESVKRIALLVEQLDHARFKVREEASKELARYGIEARKTLEIAVKKAPSEDARDRMEKLLKKIDGGAVTAQALREFRVIEVLERIGTPAARDQLAEMAKGPGDSPVVREAKAVLERWPKE